MMESEMQGVLRAGVAALAIYGGVAAAQTATESTTTQSTTYPAVPPPAYPAVPPPAPLAPPAPGTVATTNTSRSVDAYGNEVDQQRTTYRDSQGVAQDSRTVTTVAPAVPPPPPVTTTTTTTTQQTTDGPNN
jgi:hypothetical protein